MIRILLALLALLCCQGTRADERILDFHSDIRIAKDTSMEVVETIRVRAEGNRIQRGIYRDFPTHYKDANGNRVHVLFEPLGVTLDGKPEPWHTQALANGVRVYFGSADVYLGSGEFTYAFSYKTARQLGYFENHDELYWNVTGNDWDFIIDKASATVGLPGTVPRDQITVEGYTGPQGSKAQDYVATIDSQGRALIETTRALPPENGLTLVVGFPKGLVVIPDLEQKLTWFAADNRREAVLALGLLLLTGFLILQWMRVGRDPKGGVVIPEYDPPANLSPAAMRYIRNMAYDDRCFAADIVQLGVLGAVRISKDGRAQYELERGTESGRAAVAPDSAKVLYDSLLGTRSSIEFKQENHSIIGPARRAHQKELDSTQAKPNFRRNDGIGCLGGLISIATIVAAFMIDNLKPTTEAIIATVATFILASITANVVHNWIKARRDGRAVVGLSIGLLISLAINGAAVWFLAYQTSPLFALLVALISAVQVPFASWMRAPTPAGRKLLDRIEGLRLYLGVAERDDLVRAKAPPMNVEEYQRLLPYAMALDVEKTWGDQLAAAIGPAAVAAAAAGMAWYAASDSASGFDAGSFGSSLGSSLSSAVSSSSSAPGSSSGGGGGGSSGGGGGGGGGGGW